ncbi:hypothetical protein FOA43_000683 [Brettanomyces nanus]|uniref:Zn(2)-C6 fungal-type domain-containing protein n=1 Tax=Eeniella nana TaxID=13502 RepID=A0A875RXT1_EENNA|nr:uncharacterized protein FOA43_000683 [Brettanomyces nanus]QPG73373.1 hypothetical protein FOA43_000683 [Brettanomyces nanus]
MSSLDDESKIRKKRNRKFLVCAKCRRMKIKCDRKDPCSHCVKTNAKCQYTAPGGEPRTFQLKASDGFTGKWEVNFQPDQVSDNSSVSSFKVDRTSSDPTEIRSQIDQLKQQLDSLSEKVKGNNIDEISILDVPFPSMKRRVLLSKPSRTLVCGPSSRYSLIFSRPMIRFVMASMKETLDEQRRYWKKVHDKSSRETVLFREALKEDDVVDMINKVICPHYYAFQERLVFFQMNLNHLLYSNFVPMDVIHSLFLSSFHTVDNIGVAQFNRPLKCYFYADISAIVSIVLLVIVFTRYNSDGQKFIHDLSVDTVEMRSLSLQLLKLSEFRRKKTESALISLIVLRSALFVHDNSEGANEEFNSYPVFNIYLSLCFQMGIYLDTNTIDILVFKKKRLLKSRTMSPSQRKELWNYIQTEDAEYSVSMGIPLLIDYNFCAPYYKRSNVFFEKQREYCVLLLREISMKLNSLRAVSMRELLALLDKILSFFKRIPFKVFSDHGLQGVDLDEMANLLKFKFLLLDMIPALCRMIIHAISGLFDSHSFVLQNQDTFNFLTSLAQEMFRTLLFAVSLSLYMMTHICDGRSIFGKEQDGKYLIYFRDVFAKSMSTSFVLWYTLLLSKATKHPELVTDISNAALLLDYPPDYKGNINEQLNVFIIEDVLLSKHSGKSIEYCEAVCGKLLSISELINFASSLYDIMGRNESIKNSLDSFLTLKAVILWMYGLETVQECKELLNRKEMTVTDLITKTKERVESRFNMGRVDSGIKLSDENILLEKMFDSIFSESNLFDLSPDGNSQNDLALLDGAETMSVNRHSNIPLNSEINYGDYEFDMNTEGP